MIHTPINHGPFGIVCHPALAEAQARGLAALADIAAAGHQRPAVASHGNLIAAILSAIDPAFGFAAWRTMSNPEIFRLTFSGTVPTAFERLSPA